MSDGNGRPDRASAGDDCCNSHGASHDETGDEGDGPEPSPDGSPRRESGERSRGTDAGAGLDAGDDGAAELRLSVPEMDCPSCAGKVDSALRGLESVRSVETRPTSGTLTVAYDPDAATPDDVVGRVESTGYAAERGETASFDVPEMDCPSCAGKVERALSDLDGVVEYETRPTTGTVSVTYDPSRTGREGFVAAIEGAGYEVSETDDRGESPHDVWTNRRALKTWAGAALLVAGVVLEFALPASNATLTTALGREITAAWLSYMAAAAIAGQAVLREGYYSARTRSLDIDLLMSIGIVGAVVVNLPFEAATLAVLFSVAELLERFSMDRARNSLRELMELSPDTATVLRGGKERVVPADSVDVGERAVVRPGEKVPLDGTVVEGHSAVDESPITGESVPADKGTGDEVYAGSINEEGYLEVEVTAPSDESTIARVIELVEDAQANRSERERFIDRFASYYTPVIVAGAVATFVGLPLAVGVGWTEAFVRALTLLVVACPCAFVISTPVSVVSGITSGARNGVLIKGGNHLETMGEVDVVAFDKTGTLTTGELGVTDVIPLNGNSEADVLRCAGSLERRSEHPIAAAIVETAEGRGVDPREVSAFEAITGEGVRADLDDTVHYAGKPALFEDLGFDLEHAHVRTDGGREARSASEASGEAASTAEDGRPATDDGSASDSRSATDGGSAVRTGEPALADAEDCAHGSYLDLVNETLPRLQAEGKTVVLVGTEEELEGVIAIADTVRPEAAWAVARLKELGVSRVAMLTGDNARTARVIGERVGADEVRADLLPEEKVEAVRELEAEYGTVAMVGDGVNDAPALATASVGVAMGAAGTDAALETADVALMGDDLTRMPYLYELSRTANGVIRQNVWSSLAVKAALAVGAPLGLVSVIAAIVVGDMGMSLAVTGNAMRLAGVAPAEPPEPTEEPKPTAPEPAASDSDAGVVEPGAAEPEPAAPGGERTDD